MPMNIPGMPMWLLRCQDVSRFKMLVIKYSLQVIVSTSMTTTINLSPVMDPQRDEPMLTVFAKPFKPLKFLIGAPFWWA
jgi:hypothetical protein